MAGRRTALARVTGATAALAALQVALGIAAVWLQLTPPIRAAHAAVGYALWGALVWTSIRAGRWQGLLAAAPPPAAERPAEVVNAS
jgi:heme A synthase